MPFRRASGVLLHPTSLPGKHDIGDLGPEAFAFVDFLSYSGQQIWQVLPLTHTARNDSPYTAYSSFAGNPLLISLERLADEGLLTRDDLQVTSHEGSGKVKYERAKTSKIPLLRKAFEVFRKRPGGEQSSTFAKFCRSHAGWLDDYALFMALKDTFRGSPWTEWPSELRRRDARAMNQYRRGLQEQISYHRFVQFLFVEQWSKLKHYANARGVRILGDLPYYPALDSSDVWANPQFFRLDPVSCVPAEVAGVPPDYFSATGQLWGNPIYDWPALEHAAFGWWVERIRGVLAQVDLLRIDHFRGFESYWSIPVSAASAIEGQWYKAPGVAFFQTLRETLGTLPIIAEDLGIIGPEVASLRERCGFPGMRVLQFAFSTDSANPYLPHNFDANSVVYTGTHDNNTSLGWFQEDASAEERDFLRRYLGYDPKNRVATALIRLAMASVADLAVIPLQDLLGLSSEARMNFPGTAEGNWTWRYAPGALGEQQGDRLRELSELYGRLALD